MESPFEYDGFVPEGLKLALEGAYRSQRRVRVWYGYTEAHVLEGAERDSVGRSWGDEHEVTGRIGRSTGRVKIPLIIHNSRSFGGGALLTRCIIRVDDIKSRSRLYCRYDFRSGFEQSKPTAIREADLLAAGYTWEVRNDRGKVIARFKSHRKAQNFIDFQNGERYSL